MKANEVFENIYVHWSKHAKRLCASTAQGKGDIEYVRTDAFIEKAVLWMKRKSAIRYHLSEELIEDFKDYMKGE